MDGYSKFALGTVGVGTVGAAHYAYNKLLQKRGSVSSPGSDVSVPDTEEVAVLYLALVKCHKVSLMAMDYKDNFRLILQVVMQKPKNGLTGCLLLKEMLLRPIWKLSKRV